MTAMSAASIHNGTTARKWGKPQHELDFISSQRATFSCGQPGCGFRLETTLADWLVLRADHDRLRHPRLRRRKRKRIVTHQGLVVDEGTE